MISTPANNGPVTAMELSEATKARQPLRAASIDVVPDEENPGYYKGKFRFVPHYQLEGINASLRLVSELPSVKGA